MRVRRLIPLAMVTVALAPGTLVRSTPPPPDYTAPVIVERLARAPTRHGPLVLEDVWHLTSANSLFGGYSTLLVRRGTSLLAVSDSGLALQLRLEDGVLSEPRLDSFAGRVPEAKWDNDIESLAWDPKTDTIWAGFEYSNAIKRMSSRMRFEAVARPPAMRHWDDNSGPEAMARLADGRFVVIAEGTTGLLGGGHEALLFPGDPTDPGTAAPLRFTFAGLEGYKPVEMTTLPDGRVLILMRRLDWPFPPKFSSAIMIADPAAIAAGETWRAKVLVRFDEDFPADNYEGMSVEIDDQGRRHIWLISDDNFIDVQRTLVLRLRWPA